MTSSDSQATLKTLRSHHITTKVAWNCKENLRILAKHIKVTLVWILGHKGKRRFCNNIQWTIQPDLDITKTTIHGAVAEWTRRTKQVHWNNNHNSRMRLKCSNYCLNVNSLI